MIELVILNHNQARNTYRKRKQRSSCPVRVLGKPQFMTHADFILKIVNGGLVFPWLDLNFRSLVCECLAEDPRMRPDPATLLDNIKQMMQEIRGVLHQPASLRRCWRR